MGNPPTFPEIRSFGGPFLLAVQPGDWFNKRLWRLYRAPSVTIPCPEELHMTVRTSQPIAYIKGR